MGKRSNFERVERDYYPTPFQAVTPFGDLLRGVEYVEPCAGDGALIDHLKQIGALCVESFDIEPQAEGILQGDALNHNYDGKFVITNPPWKRDFLHPFIRQIINTGGECWLLFDADWMHTKQAAELMEYCDKIISIGRLKWIADSKHTGKDNCRWYHFTGYRRETVFKARTARF